MCHRRQHFQSEVPARPAPSAPPGLRLAQDSHTPETGSSPPTQAPSPTHPPPPKASPWPQLEQGRALLGQASDTYKRPGVLGEGWGSLGGSAGLTAPPLPACPSGHPLSSQGVLTDGRAQSASWEGSYCLRYRPAETPGGREGGGEGRKGREGRGSRGGEQR